MRLSPDGLRKQIDGEVERVESARERLRRECAAHSVKHFLVDQAIHLAAKARDTECTVALATALSALRDIKE